MLRQIDDVSYFMISSINRGVSAPLYPVSWRRSVFMETFSRDMNLMQGSLRRGFYRGGQKRKVGRAGREPITIQRLVKLLRSLRVIC